MLIVLLLMYVIPVYFIFFRYKLLPFTTFWKVSLWIPPVVGLFFLWFALGRYTPLAQTAYVQAPVVQIAPEAGGFVTELSVKDNEEVTGGTTLFQIDQRPYQYRVDQAKGRLTEVQEGVLALLADVYATQEAVGVAEANVLVAKQNLAAAFEDLETATKAENDAAQQLELAENSAGRNATLVASGSISQEEHENSLRDVTAQRSKLNEAQNRVSQAKTITEISSLQLNSSEATVRQAGAERGKAEVMLDPVKTLRRVIDTRQLDLQRLEQPLPGSDVDRQERASRVQEVTAELERLRGYLEKAAEVDPFRSDVHPSVRQAIEALNETVLALERTAVKAPSDGVVSNLQLTEGTYVRPGVPVATFIDTKQWRLVAAVPENWLENVRPGDEVYYSLRNYPGRIRSGKVAHIGRGVLQGQGIPSGNLPDTDPRQTRQPDTPQPGQEFQVIVSLLDDQPNQPLRVGLTGRVTIFASGGLPVVNQLATIFHTVFSWLDYLYPKPSPLVVMLGVVTIVGGVIWFRSKMRNGIVL